MKLKFLMLGIVISLFVTSCTKKDDTNTATISTDEAIINSKIDAANNDVASIIEEQLEATLIDVKAKTASTSLVNGALPACASVTRVPALGVTPAAGDLITKTIDFGTSGCPLGNGNILRGKIIMSFTYQPNATSNTVTYTFVDFYHNARKFNGTKTFIRTMSVATAASPAHPIVTMNMDLTMTLPDGRTFTRIGSRTREIIAGFNTPLNPNDNVYSVTGDWTTTYPNTILQNSVITSPLIIKMACSPANSPISQGVIAYTRNSRVATLDYGDGTCDNTAIFTIDGVSRTITLGN